VVVLSHRSELGSSSRAFAGPTIFGPRLLRAWLIAVALALPFYAAFTFGHTYGLTWLGVPGVAVVLLVGAVARFGTRRESLETKVGATH
jgi:hypothetical protein